MAIKRVDKYADFRYKIIFSEEEREAKWLIEQGLFKDMEDYIAAMTRVEKRIMRREESEKKKRTAAKSKKLLATAKRDKAA